MLNADVQRKTDELRAAAEDIQANNPALQCITFLVGLHAKGMDPEGAEKLVAATLEDFPLDLQDFDLLNSYHTELAQAFTDFNLKVFRTCLEAGIIDPFNFDGLRP